VRSLNQGSDKRVLQISQLHSRQTGDRCIRICLPDRSVRVLGISCSSEVAAEHVRGRGVTRQVDHRSGGNAVQAPNASPLSTVVVRVTRILSVFGLGDDKVDRSIRSPGIVFDPIHNPASPMGVV